MRTRTGPLVAVALLCLVLVGCASPAPSATHAATAPALSIPTGEPTSTPTNSDGAQPEASTELTTGRLEAQGACEIIHRAQATSESVMRQAAAEAERAAQLNPHWTQLAAAMSAMRDYAAKYANESDIPEADSRQDAANWQTTQDLCKELTGTTLFIA